MANILCDCGCGKQVIRPVYFGANCRMIVLRRGNKALDKGDASVTKHMKSDAGVTPEYEYAANPGGKTIRRMPGGDWEIQNPMTNKWVAME